MSGSFFDTNVLLGLAFREERDASKVLGLLAGGGLISVQVLNEIANVSRKKHRKPWPEIIDFLGLVREFLTVVPVTVQIHEQGLELAEKHGFSTYDAMIVAAALTNDCDTLWSEDMHHGMMVAGRLRISNPFKD
ncbi:PIN domain-containing protein [Mesorhizobium sp. LHD-90]|uniref:PIN domain-containing protein n=1 Tax=Mesorhizobium sp. LHD-90 TaxID=3071414 RepID=UPI0027E04A5C|nr:PIN domain-containing protein [Mesorhizobium sp. LHD-90]MDQ6432473.1 PIN domain-containing protein [Mesorhizobium sp. LHD-90]